MHEFLTSLLSHKGTRSYRVYALLLSIASLGGIFFVLCFFLGGNVLVTVLTGVRTVEAFTDQYVYRPVRLAADRYALLVGSRERALSAAGR